MNFALKVWAPHRYFGNMDTSAILAKGLLGKQAASRQVISDGSTLALERIQTILLRPAAERQT